MLDFVVVGAGPAGSRFARRAAENGYSVTVFERGEIGTPLACSGHVSLDIWDYLPDSAREELFQNDIYGARFHLGGPKSKSYPFYRSRVVSNAIDRIGLDKRLATVAREAGAIIKEQHTVTGVEEHEDHVVVSVKTPASATCVSARMIVGCDGPRSRVRQALGLSAPTEVLHGVLGFDDTPDDDDFVDVHLTVPGFFAWRIPRGTAGVEYGLAAKPTDNVKQRFNTLVTEYHAQITRTCSGAIPIGPPAQVTSHRGFLLGDAAAQTKPFTGGGILYGLIAADCAADCIDPTDPETLAVYETAWRDELQLDQRLGSVIRQAYSLPTPIQRLGLRAFAGEIGVHMDRPTSFFTTEQFRALFSR